jgi:hypothetical protein
MLCLATQPFRHASLRGNISSSALHNVFVPRCLNNGSASQLDRSVLLIYNYTSQAVAQIEHSQRSFIFFCISFLRSQSAKTKYRYNEKYHAAAG